jgi:RNA polymerase sigma factor (sigma-70 family)
MTHADTVAGPVGPPGPSVPTEPADLVAGPTEPTEPTELVRRHRGRVLRLATRLTGNRSDAEDLTQEVFVRALTAGDTLRPDAVEGWLHRVTTNLFLDHARRRSRVRVDPWGEHLEARVRPAAAADVPLLGATFESDVEAALEALVPAVRAVVVLVDLEGLSYAEAASVLGLKVGTVRSRLHRGRSQLRRALAHRDPARPAPPARQIPPSRTPGRRGPRMRPPGLLGPPPLSV